MRSKDNRVDNKGHRWLLVALGLLIFAVLILGGMYLMKLMPKPYSAVVLANGDVYFGQVSNFPKFSLSNAYILQIGFDPNIPEQSIPEIVPADLLLWAPEKLFINRDQVLSISTVGENSQVMQLIRSREVAQ